MSTIGHHATVISATRQPGRLHGTVISEEWNGITVHRIVNNIPALPLSSLERRPEIENIIASLIPENTDLFAHSAHPVLIVEVSLSKDLTVWTLHDAWGWCPAGGTLLYNQKHTLCKRQNSVDCVTCYANWKPQIPKSGQRLMKIAQLLSPMIPPSKLHRMWQRLPNKFRISYLKETSTSSVESEDHVHARNQQFKILSEKLYSC